MLQAEVLGALAARRISISGSLGVQGRNRACAIALTTPATTTTTATARAAFTVSARCADGFDAFGSSDWREHALGDRNGINRSVGRKRGNRCCRWGG